MKENIPITSSTDKDCGVFGNSLKQIKLEYIPHMDIEEDVREKRRNFFYLVGL